MNSWLAPLLLLPSATPNTPDAQAWRLDLDFTWTQPLLLLPSATLPPNTVLRYTRYLRKARRLCSHLDETYAICISQKQRTHIFCTKPFFRLITKQPKPVFVEEEKKEGIAFEQTRLGVSARLPHLVFADVGCSLFT